MRLAGWVQSRSQGGLPATGQNSAFMLHGTESRGSLQRMIGPDYLVTESPYGECIVRDENRSMERVCSVRDNGWVPGTYCGAYCELGNR